ncbi:hypothetical protein KC367_g733 [Hortaea werneckii]|uniref:Uncharacterized protein n=2 Tax=Hortaea werneckii TaxID=91943 RepID=A0A3M7J8G6_HORWE|nr:hypothetical protein KC361_g5462 [Hortaea werneckii]OTA33792.1 hypothetical protein BTJ68_08111 [Hortaea werneckii EXF-2000]KAI6838629.1 hypothetical protein KC342_g3954 [Hortaea werneckii]KAI6851265.1 hypothetical protein KC358_g306 [Hortaea werneckii]KAI6852937.1 hypothetical protein KC350_g411 [Hortaea werneckii]
MYFKNILTATAASLALANASPVPAESSDQQQGFEVSNFIFGCTAGCYWYFNATVSGDSANHPCVSTPVYCNGNLDDDTDYKECTSTGSDSSSISAFIEKASNTLFLRYTVSDVEAGSTYNYYGNDTVYAATSSDADKQEPKFFVPETSVTAVA